MDVSIIIVNYNTLGLTSDCIESIVDKTSDLEYEIILVDNASTDSSKAVFSQDPRVRYIYSDRNLGFGRANNLGIREATGRYLFFLNSDTILLNNAVKYFFDFCEKNPDRRVRSCPQRQEPTEYTFVWAVYNAAGRDRRSAG